MRVPVILLALLLGGCAGAPATRFYAVAPVPVTSAPASVAATKSQAPSTIIVREISLPHYLDRPQIVTRTSAHRLHFAEFAHWGGNLREDLTRALAENLARRLTGSAVLPAPTFSAARPDLTLDVEVLRFEAADDGMVHLVARWRAAGASAGSPVREVALSLPRPGDSVDAALVGVMSELLGDLAATIAPTLSVGGR
jgi:uncharacterized lipoprotein YmbA